jgi:hypothetical protein
MEQSQMDDEVSSEGLMTFVFAITETTTWEVEAPDAETARDALERWCKDAMERWRESTSGAPDEGWTDEKGVWLQEMGYTARISSSDRRVSAY